MKKAQWENWINLVLGIWFFIMPWLALSRVPTSIVMMVSWNAWIVGAAVALSAGLALRNLKPWEEWVNLVLGIWIVLSPWSFGYVNEAGPFWNSIIVGAAIAIFSGLAIPVAQNVQH